MPPRESDCSTAFSTGASLAGVGFSVCDALWAAAGAGGAGGAYALAYGCSAREID